MSESYTQINEDGIFYLMKRNEKPDIYLPLEPENITETTIVGEGVTGTLTGNVQVQAGKVNQGLNLTSGGQIKINSVSCLINMGNCGNMMSLMMWIKPTKYNPSFGHITYSYNSMSITYSGYGTLGSLVLNEPYKIGGLFAVSIAPIDVWTHVAIVYDQKLGVSIFVNGVFESFKSISNAAAHTAQVHRTKGGNVQHGYEGVLDEIKIFFKRLSIAGECCFVLYNSDFIFLKHL